MICQGQKCHTTFCLHYSKLAMQPGTSMIMQIEALLPYQNHGQNAWETDFNKGDTFYLSKADINNLWLISLWKHINNRRLWTARWISCLHFPHFSPFLPDSIFFYDWKPCRRLSSSKENRLASKRTIRKCWAGDEVMRNHLTSWKIGAELVSNLSLTSQQPGLCQDILIIKDELVSSLVFTPGL